MGDDRQTSGGDVPAQTRQNKERLTEAALQARGRLGEAVEATKAKARDVAEQQKRAGAGRLDTLANAVQSAAKNIEPDMPQAAGYMHDTADRLAGMSSALRERSVEDLVGQFGEFARKQPALLFGGALLAGIALSRFLKSSDNGASGRSRPGGGYL
jgi:hypothetical protein